MHPPTAVLLHGKGEDEVKTRVCELLGIEHPIIQGGMVWIATPELASAVSNAGGLGQLTSGKDPEKLRASIRQTKEMTDKPFGVNIPLLLENAPDLIQVAIDEKVQVVITSAGNPAKFTGHIKEQGIRVCHVVPSVRMAQKAEGSGVDLLVAEGWEAGGHNAYDDVTLMALVPQVVDAVQVPVVAAGGIADARGFVAAFALGAEAVQLGTRFVMTKECVAHEKYKEAVAAAPDTGTVITGRTFGPTRILKNKLAEDIISWEYQGVSAKEILERLGAGRSEKALLHGDMEEGSPMIGQIAGMIDEILSVQEVFDLILGEVKPALERLQKTLGS